MVNQFQQNLSNKTIYMTDMSMLFLSLFTSNDTYMLDKGNYITRSDYSNGYCLYMLNINDTGKSEDQLPLKKRVTLD